MTEKAKKVEEIAVKDFLKLPEAAPEFRRRKVDYEAVIAAITDRVLSAAGIAKIMMAHATNKKKVYYSEVTGFLDRLEKKGYKVEKRAGSVVYYYVHKAPEGEVEEAEEAPAEETPTEEAIEAEETPTEEGIEEVEEVSEAEETE